MGGDEFPACPPKPRLVLRVGITGKRAIPGDERERIHKSFAEVFDALGRFLIARRDSDFFAQRPPLLRIISGMAEGADQIAADVAIERFKTEGEKEKDTGARREVETRLAAILPFAQSEYEEDFRKDPNRPKGKQDRTETEWQETIRYFRGLLDGPAVESKLEINDEAILNKQRPEDRNLAYAALGDVLREHTDVLVAVSDEIDGGPGGTVDVIRIAVKEGIPVIKISTTKPEIYVMRAADPDAPDQTPREDEKFRPAEGLPDKFRDLLDRMIEPPQQPAAAGVSQQHHSEEESRPARVRIETFFGEHFEPAYFSWIFKCFRDALTVQAEPHERLCSKAFAAFRTSWRKYGITRPDKVANGMWPPEYDSLTQDRGAHIRRVLAQRHGWADALAVQYADATRSAYIAIAFLGAMAVLVGLLALLGPGKLLTEIKIAALLLEGLILAAAGFYFFRRPHNGRWHQRVIEYRAIAELLRHQRFVYALGGADRLERTADRAWRAPDAWVGWYVRATLRELGFPSAVLSAEHRGKVLNAFREAELEGDNGQIAYNQSLAKRFNMIDERLGKLVRIAFAVTLGAAVVGTVLLTVLAAFEPGHRVLDLVKPYFTVIMAFVPALIAAVHGIRFQMEFKNTAERAAATGRELSELAKRLSEALPPGTQPGRRFGLSYVRSANEAMSSDLAGWTNVYRGKVPEPP